MLLLASVPTFGYTLPISTPSLLYQIVQKATIKIRGSNMIHQIHIYATNPP